MGVVDFIQREYIFCRKTKKFLRRYRATIETDAYQNHIEKRIRESIEITKSYNEQERPELLSKTDFNQERTITKILFFDVLSNEGVGKLAKKLHSLNSKKFIVNNYYKKPSIIRNYDYVHLSYTSRGVGLFANVEVKNNAYLKSIDIRWTQVDNYFALFEYSFNLKKAITGENFIDFVKSTFTEFTAADYFEIYEQDNRKGQSVDFLDIIQTSDAYVLFAFQHYITTYLYTERGRTNRIPGLEIRTRTEQIDIQNVYLPDFSTTFYSKANNYYISNLGFDNVYYGLFAGGRSVPSFSLLGDIAKYGNNLYYSIFGVYELKIFERDFSKFSSGRKAVGYNRYYKQLLAKVQGISDVGRSATSDSYEEWFAQWNIYYGNKEMEFSELSIKDSNYYKNVFKTNLDYQKSLIEIRYTRSNMVIAVIAVAISLVALFAT